MYINKLLKKKKTIAIRTLFLTEERRREVTHLQLPKSQEEFENLKAGDFSNKLEEFIGGTGPDSGTCKIATYTELLDRLHKMQNAKAKVFQEIISSSYKEVDSLMPIYLWIADEDHAVFSIPTFGSEPTEHGFYTRDRELIASLRRLWERYTHGSLILKASFTTLHLYVGVSPSTC